MSSAKKKDCFPVLALKSNVMPAGIKVLSNKSFRLEIKTWLKEYLCCSLN